FALDGFEARLCCLMTRPQRGCDSLTRVGRGCLIRRYYSAGWPETTRRRGKGRLSACSAGRTDVIRSCRRTAANRSLQPSAPPHSFHNVAHARPVPVHGGTADTNSFG